MKRILSLDLAKGFTVLMIAPIHIVMMYSNVKVQHSIFGNILAFIAEGPGAQLFMLLMGVGITFSSRNTGNFVVKRAFYFLLAAYGLNVFKFLIPNLLFGLPQNLLTELPVQGRSSILIFFLSLGDILHFAALAYPLTYLVHRQKNYPYLAAILGLLIIFVSPYLWDLKTSNSILNYLLTLMGGHPPFVFFPLFPWLVYPLAGLTLGYCLHQKDTSRVLKNAGLVGFMMVTFYWAFPVPETISDWLPFYRTGPIDTMAHLGIVLVWMWIIDRISKIIPFNSFFKLLTFCSKNITAIYLIQWIIICWVLPFTGYQTFGFLITFFFIVTITTVTLLLTRIYVQKNI